MRRVLIYCTILALAAAQNGYDYNRPNRPFSSTSSRPGTSPGPTGSTTPYPIRPQSDDYNKPTTSYPSGPQGYPGSEQRPGYPGPQHQGPSGPPSGSYQGPSGPSEYPGQGPNGPTNYPSHGSSTPYPHPSDSSFQGHHSPSSPGFPSHGGSNYPGQGSNFPGQSGSNFGVSSFGDDGSYQNGDYSAIPGQPDIDYPIFSYIPQTSFDCKAQPYPGYYADVEARCQVFHVCANNRTYDFLCPNGTVFSQEDFVCVWWNQFSCNSAPSLYELNAKIYDYSIKGSDYSNFDDFSGASFPGNRGQGHYPGSTPRPSSFSSNFGPQGPTTPYPGQSTTAYSQQGSSGNFPGFQGVSSGFPGSNDNYPGSYPSGPQGSTSSSSYPGSTASYADSSSQGYSSGRPNGAGHNGGNGRPVPKPNRDYLPPRN